MAEADRAIAARAAQHHGVITVSVAEQLGLTRAMRRSRLASGQLVEVDRGVLRIAGAPVTFEAVARATTLAGGPGALASHRMAAALWGFDEYRPGVREITIPRGRTHRRDGVIVHESTDLDRTTPRVHRGVPITDPARTLLDIALRSSDRRLLAAIESARRARLTTWPELIATLLAHARRGRPGVQRLRRVLAANIDRDEITDSGFEALVLALLAEHDIDRPVLHHRVIDAAGHLVAIVDLAYPELKIAIELDGQVHLRREVFERDRPRQNRLELLGWTVLRFTWAMYASAPEVIVREILAALRRAHAA
jgi:hypothetical protein